MLFSFKEKDPSFELFGSKIESIQEQLLSFPSDTENLSDISDRQMELDSRRDDIIVNGSLFKNTNVIAPYKHLYQKFMKEYTHISLNEAKQMARVALQCVTRTTSG